MRVVTRASQWRRGQNFGERRAKWSISAQVKLRKIDTAKDIASTVSRNQGKVYLNADSLLINILGKEDLAEEDGAKKKGWFRK